MKIYLKSGNSFNISEDNAKMGKVFSFSVLPIATCKENAPCTKNCYACKLAKMRKNVKNSWLKNTEVLSLEDKTEIAKKIALACQLQEVKFFRWNVGGDFGINGYFDLACKVAELAPDTKFLAFTKFYELADLPKPENFNLILSVWNDFRPKNIDNYATAHYNDGSRSMPENAIKCGGNCEKCGLCFNLKKGESIYFDKH